MTQRVSIKDVAKAAGVSTATVSNVFSGKKPVNDDLATKVRDVASRLGYQVNKAASLLRSGKNSVVSVLVPDLSDPFFTSIITEIEHLATDDGYEIIVGNSNDNVQTEAGRLDALLAWQPSGLIIVPCSDKVPDRIRKADGPPCVFLDRISELDVADTVTIDNVGAGVIAAKHLTDKGHTRVLVAASDLDLAPIRERARGVEAQVEKVGGTVDFIELGSEPQIGAETMAKWIDVHPLPSAIVATTDMTTLAALSCMASRKFDLPEQISVVGFDDYAWMQARRTGITVIKQPVEDIAASAWELLKKRMNGDASPIVNRIHECGLIARDSVRNIGRSNEPTERSDPLDTKLIQYVGDGGKRMS
ncbi:LacI family transcriptional regulator [Paracoccaceae bacterium]|jgi:LacI family transcriptional regulator|nr:LacI family transcriptional regulator [Paracoccaceae bacterium]MDB2609721.1 LacI family transcriptional regulator [Paracoccaceae bacterium]